MGMTSTNSYKSWSTMRWTSMRLMKKRRLKNTCRMWSKKTGKSFKGYYEEILEDPTMTCLKCTRCNKTKGTGYRGWKGWSSGWKSDKTIKKTYMPKMTHKMMKWTTTMTTTAIRRESKRRGIIIIMKDMKRTKTKRRIMGNLKRSYRSTWWIPFRPVKSKAKLRLLVSWLWSYRWWVRRALCPGWIVLPKNLMKTQVLV